MSLGPVMLDLRGSDLAPDEIELLHHPLVGGVILFSRNYTGLDELVALTTRIHALRTPPLLIAVDHEGGRVQRFRDGFTRLPPAARFGQLYDRDRKSALQHATQAGWLMAAELLAVGVDFSFAPVLDVDTGRSKVIGDRAFHHDPDALSALAKAYCKGMKTAGMAAVGKHFPGHGHVREDSHEEIPVDKRSLEDLLMHDIIPFERLAGTGIAGVMPAHVIYPQIDSKPAGFSRIWLDGILRQRLGFQGAIFSDDIVMAGAATAGGYPDRAMAALQAGCDMVLVCNNQAAAIEVIQNLEWEPHPLTQVRLMRMRAAQHDMTRESLHKDPHWREISARISALENAPELDLGDDEIPV